MRHFVLISLLVLMAGCSLTPEQERRQRIAEVVSERRGLDYNPPSVLGRTLTRLQINPGVYITFTF